jgi:hypothetical protein
MPTNDGLIDRNYLTELFENSKEILKEFYLEYFKELCTYELTKKLPAEELKELITSIYTRRKIGVSKVPVQAPATQSTGSASDIDEPMITPTKPPLVIATKPSQQPITPIVSQPSVSHPSSKKKKKKGSGLYDDDEYDDEYDYSGSIKSSKNVYNLIPIKPRHVSVAFRKFLLNFLQTRQFDASAHFDLNKEEKFLFNSIAKYIGFDLDQLDTDDSFAKRWDVIMGELNAGNDSKDLKREARQYIILAQNMGMLTRDNANGIIWQYNL